MPHDYEGSWDFDTAYARDIDREPTLPRSVRPRPALNENGSVRTQFERSRACPIDHVALKTSPDWSMLRHIGVQKVESFGDEPAYELELANCSCGTTLARVKETPTEDALALLRKAGAL